MRSREAPSEWGQFVFTQEYVALFPELLLLGMDDSDDDDDATSCGALEGESPTTETVHLRRLANIDVFKDSGNGNARGSRIGRKCNLCKKFLLFM